MAQYDLFAFSWPPAGLSGPVLALDRPAGDDPHRLVRPVRRRDIRKGQPVRPLPEGRAAL